MGVGNTLVSKKKRYELDFQEGVVIFRHELYCFKNKSFFDIFFKISDTNRIVRPLEILASFEFAAIRPRTLLASMMRAGLAGANKHAVRAPSDDSGDVDARAAGGNARKRVRVRALAVAALSNSGDGSSSAACIFVGCWTPPRSPSAVCFVPLDEATHRSLGAGGSKQDALCVGSSSARTQAVLAKRHCAGSGCDSDYDECAGASFAGIDLQSSPEALSEHSPSAASRPDLAPQSPPLALKAPECALQTYALALKAPECALQTPALALKAPECALQIPARALKAFEFAPLNLAPRTSAFALQPRALALQAPETAMQTLLLAPQAPRLGLQPPALAPAPAGADAGERVVATFSGLNLEQACAEAQERARATRSADAVFVSTVLAALAANRDQLAEQALGKAEAKNAKRRATFAAKRRVADAQKLAHAQEEARWDSAHAAAALEAGQNRRSTRVQLSSSCAQAPAAPVEEQWLYPANAYTSHALSCNYYVPGGGLAGCNCQVEAPERKRRFHVHFDVHPEIDSMTVAPEFLPTPDAAAFAAYQPPAGHDMPPQWPDLAEDRARLCDAATPSPPTPSNSLARTPAPR